MSNGTELGDKLVEKYELGKKQERERIKYLIENYPNPYPKDIFEWCNKEKLDFDRGRFNQHCYSIVKTLKQALLEEIDDE